jgi:acyl-CoA synthetase (NDP forming)
METNPDTLKSIFEPRSIAVVGASRSPDTIGYVILDSLLRDGYTGAVYPVNPHAEVVHSIRAYPSELPDPAELAMIVVPKEVVLQVATECGEAGVKGLVVISAGFREVGGEGVERERQLHGRAEHRSGGLDERDLRADHATDRERGVPQPVGRHGSNYPGLRPGVRDRRQQVHQPG